MAAKLTRDAAADNRDQLALTGLRAAGDDYRFINLDGNGKTVSEFGVIMALLFRLLTARGHRASVTGLRETK